MESSTGSDRLLLLCGGGTGGHVFPGLAVAAELRRRNRRVAWLGRPGGREEAMVTAAALAYHPLPAAPVLGRGPAGRAAAVWTLLVSTARAARLIRRLGAAAVIGTGGFVSVPGVLGARLAGCETVLLEPNAGAGLANRFLSRFARIAAVAYPATARQLRCPAEVTGVPVREDFLSIDPRLPAAPPRRLLVVGGSQGARQINQALPPALERMAERLRPLEVLHQAGPDHLESTEQAYEPVRARGVQVTVVGFLERMAEAMAGCHLVVSRAGAVTLAEICAAGRPAALAPLAIAGGHQAENAALLVEEGGAALLESGEEASWDVVLTELLEDLPRLQQMGSLLRRLSRPDAAGRIADLAVAAGGGR